MDVLLDSTVFWDDPNIRSEAWRLIREYVRRTNSRVFIPAVVRDEIEAKFIERLKEQIDQLGSAKDSVTRLTETAMERQGIDIPGEAAKYGRRLDQRLKVVSAQQLPYPSITHAGVVQRQLKRLRPFQPKGSGYRDALIWMSLLEKLKKEDRDCVIVTKNAADFSQHKDDSKSLHEDFQSDLKSEGINAGIEIRHNLSEFVDDFVKPVLTKLDDFRAELERGRPIDLKEQLEEHFSQVFEGLQKTRLRIKLPGVRLQEPIGISSLGEPSNLEIDEVLELNENEVYIDFHALYDAEIFGFLFTADAYSLSEESDVYVTDIDWNAHYVEVGANIELEVRFGAMYEREEKLVQSLEVKEAQGGKEY